MAALPQKYRNMLISTPTITAAGISVYAMLMLIST